MTAALFAATPTAPGFFVTIEGPNGSGKTALTVELGRALARRGHAVHSTAQPSPTALGRTIRALEQSVGGRAFACLIAGDRHHQLESEIGPALARGKIVLCDRYIESSLVLQRIDGVHVDYVLAINAGIIRPDLRIRLFADDHVLSERVAGRGVVPSRRFEQSPAASTRELRLYEEADELLVSQYNLTANVYDTTNTHAPALGSEVADAIERGRR